MIINLSVIFVYNCVSPPPCTQERGTTLSLTLVEHLLQPPSRRPVRRWAQQPSRWLRAGACSRSQPASPLSQAHVGRQNLIHRIFTKYTKHAPILVTPYLMWKGTRLGHRHCEHATKRSLGQSSLVQCSESEQGHVCSTYVIPSAANLACSHHPTWADAASQNDSDQVRI